MSDDLDVQALRRIMLALGAITGVHRPTGR
jgi:hypothetical protein